MNEIVYSLRVGFCCFCSIYVGGSLGASPRIESTRALGRFEVRASQHLISMIQNSSLPGHAKLDAGILKTYSSFDEPLLIPEMAREKYSGNAFDMPALPHIKRHKDSAENPSALGHSQPTSY